MNTAMGSTLRRQAGYTALDQTRSIRRTVPWDKQRKVGGGTDKRGFNEVGGEQKPEWTE